MDRQLADKDDDDSVIYVSDTDDSVVDITEIKTQNGSVESITLDDSSEEEEEEDENMDDDDMDTKDDGVVLQEEKFIVTETVEEIQREIVKKYENKATQTYDNEFPAKVPSPTVTAVAPPAAPNTSETNIVTNNSESSRAVTFGLKQTVPTTSGSVSTNIATVTTTTRATNQSNGDNPKLNSRNSTRENSPVRNNISRTRRTYNHTRSYRNYRVQPYRRYNNNYNGNYNRPNYRRYGNYNNNGYHNRNYSNGNNRFGTARYNNNYYNNPYNNVQRYRNQYFTNQFKERLFRGFIDLMDYLFDYNYYQNTYY